MQPLTEKFLSRCPEENGFRMRGMAMTRIEVFVDAAFAFAVTMLVISIDQIPNSVPELMAISKYIPGFTLSVAMLVYIWYNHSTWSKQFGLEDGKTVFLSTSLLVVVLVYIYPLKMMFQAMFSWLTGGYLPSEFELNRWNELRMLFHYFAIGFFLISLIFKLLYSHAIKLHQELKLSNYESYQTRTEILINWNIMLVSLLAFFLPMLVPDQWVPITGFTYVLLGPTCYAIYRQRVKYRQQRVKPTNSGL